MTVTTSLDDAQRQFISLPDRLPVGEITSHISAPGICWQMCRARWRSEVSRRAASRRTSSCHGSAAELFA